MKLNKIMFATASVLALGAATTAAQAGVYAGVKGGWSHISTKHRALDDNGDVVGSRIKLKGNGFAADLIAGYNTNVSGIELGAEASVGIDTASKKRTFTESLVLETPFGTFQDSATFQARVARKVDTSIAAVAGYEVAPGITPYAKLGLGFTKFQLTLTDEDGRLKKSKYAYTYTPAVGVKYAVTEKVSAIAEAALAVTPKKKFKFADGNIEMRKAYTSSVKVGAVYNV